MNWQQAYFLLQGLWGTIVLSLLTFLFGGILAFVLALTRISPLVPLRFLAATYIQIIQGIPLLVIMGICYFGPAIVGGYDMPALAAATLAMTVYSAAFLADIWRSALQAVPKPQWEAAECLGLTRWQRMRQVIIPQAIRISTPPTVGFMVQIIKNTSIASLVIGYSELGYFAKLLNNSTFQPFLFFGAAAALYFIISYPLSVGSRVLERKLNAANR
ncbi:amino acid ABC transporter permease [Devosia salina]|uniref:Amino acid ABC transporter permease n=1 Tax=Devosia salina TaxID=2860336 RepID=A0ABX8W9S9_9HYPH|nr:amino acid ABC transporter permease [Devosia salina]QYO75638.1 amino acid ABC transporter permease [Devosia salina]